MGDKEILEEIRMSYVMSIVAASLSVLNLAVIMFFAYVVFKSL